MSSANADSSRITMSPPKARPTGRRGPGPRPWTSLQCITNVALLLRDRQVVDASSEMLDGTRRSQISLFGSSIVFCLTIAALRRRRTSAAVARALARAVCVALAAVPQQSSGAIAHARAATN